jgi:hypothetical protein
MYPIGEGTVTGLLIGSGQLTSFAIVHILLKLGVNSSLYFVRKNKGKLFNNFNNKYFSVLSGIDNFQFHHIRFKETKAKEE